MEAVLFIFLWFGSAFLAALICNWIGRFCLHLIAKLKKYFEKRKEKKKIEQKYANNFLNYSTFYAKEKFKEELTMPWLIWH
jgi:hypothetical protein